MTTRIGPKGMDPECPIIICECVKCDTKLDSGCIMKMIPLAASSPVTRNGLGFQDMTNAPADSIIALIANIVTNDSSVSPVWTINAANHDSINNTLPAKKSTANTNVAAANPTDRRPCTLIFIFAWLVIILSAKIMIH